LADVLPPPQLQIERSAPSARERSVSRVSTESSCDCDTTAAMRHCNHTLAILSIRVIRAQYFAARTAGFERAAGLLRGVLEGSVMQRRVPCYAYRHAYIAVAARIFSAKK